MESTSGPEKVPVLYYTKFDPWIWLHKATRCSRCGGDEKLRYLDEQCMFLVREWFDIVCVAPAVARS